MEEALEMARAKDTKERMAGVEHLHQYLETSSKCLSSSEVTSLVDVCLDLLKDNNFRVSQGALQSLASAAVLSGEHLKLHFNALVPAVVERLGDGKQPVRDAARRLLITLMEVSSPTIIVERAGSYAWMHKSWRVREEFARTVTSAINLFSSTELPLQRAILPSILQMLNDSNHVVREAAISCIVEMYSQGGTQFRDELQRHHVPPHLIKDINARLQHVEPKNRSSEVSVLNFGGSDTRAGVTNIKRSSPRSKGSTREVSIFGGDADVADKPVEAVRVYSERELSREVEKIISTLVPEKDWSIRISAMQRVEGLVCGGASEYPCFHILLKQLVSPLTVQLSDRRSSIVKQACHLLSFLSKELLGDFEPFVEMFVPVLFKLVVITVLVIAESADNCIKTMLRNCKVPRVLPRLADSAKNDRSAVLRARCCEYALLVLEYWADAPEIQKSADLYEDLIKCCVGDAMSEVRSTARTCYRMFAKTWPDRSRRLFLSFDPVIQRVINDEGGGIHKRYASPSLRERGNQLLLGPQGSVSSSLPGYGPSAIVAMDRGSNLSSGASITSGLLLSQENSFGKGVERSLESVLHASKERVTAIESMLRGLDISDKQNSSTIRSSSLDLEVDPPSSRDPPFPLAAPASGILSSFSDSLVKGGNNNGSLVLSNIVTQIPIFKDTLKLSVFEHASLSYPKRVPERQERSTIEEGVFSDARQSTSQHVDRQYLDIHARDLGFRDSQSSYIPNFQRPLLRKHASGRVPAGRKKSFEESQFGDVSSYGDGPVSLNDALAEGLGPTSDWSVRVAAFNYIRSLLQQGPKGVQEVSLSFDKVMKLFFRHLDDPHHKVAQAALSTLADLILSCRKPFESYMERILPSVFSRLIDSKELVRQPCSTTLETLSRTYGIDSLLPALLRSLDEQRSPKAKLAVIEFAITSFTKHATNLEGTGNFGILKLWLAKLAPLVHDKNTKLKEAAITCIISIYTHFDSTAVLNYMLALSVEEQNSLRRALKQYTPRIEVDVVNFLQNKKERQRSKSSYDQSDVVGTSSEEGYPGLPEKTHFISRHSVGSVENENSRKWVPVPESFKVSIGNAICNAKREQLYGDNRTSSTAVLELRTPNDMSAIGEVSPSKAESLGSWTRNISENRNSVKSDRPPSPCIDAKEKTSSDRLISSETPNELGLSNLKHQAVVVMSPETGPSISQILHLISNGKDQNFTADRQSSLQHLIDASISNDLSIWSKYFNQILTVVLEVLEDPDSTVREITLSLLSEMLKNQKDAMEDAIEIVIEKLLNVSKDVISKVTGEAEHCLTTALSQYDTFRCLSVIVPLLVNEDEKTLVTCVNCLTKLVSRLSQAELMSQLPTFLPALFDAFGSQNADVRKTVVFCLVDIYIMLGRAFLPYLEGLNSTQLRLVTIYANRISQARTGMPIDGSQD